MPGCTDDCHGHGQCQATGGQNWHCVCEQGFTGDHCQIAQETQCNDKDDNDKDGLVDGSSDGSVDGVSEGRPTGESNPTASEHECQSPMKNLEVKFYYQYGL